MYEIEDIADIIENAGVAAIGKDLFLYHAPAEVSECVILYPSNDPPMIDGERPYYMKGKFQTIVRAKTHDEGNAICKQLSDALYVYNVEGAQSLIKQIRPLHQARVYRRSDNGILEFSINYTICYVQK